MVAASIGAGEIAPFEEDHEHKPGDDHSRASDDSAEFIHPWAREMFKKGLSFNGNERNKLFLGDGHGSFADFSDLLGADTGLDGRAVLATDFDDDGDADLFIHNLQRGRHTLFRNEAETFETTGHSLKIRLEATRSQYEAVGATVEVAFDGRRCAQVLSRGSGFASCQAPELIFGIGTASTANISVRWPGGERESFGRVSAPGIIRLVQGRGAAIRMTARPTKLADPLPSGLKLGLGARVPQLVLLDSKGERWEFDPVREANGGRLYLAFWASYCQPCIAEVPELMNRHREAGSKVVAVSVDVGGHHERARKVLTRAGARYPLAFLAMEEDANAGGLDELVDLLRLPIPTTLVLGPDGTIEDVLRGPLDER
ncbi:MAG: peroxiredoxin [Planctomycetota bacterium]